MNKGWLGIKGIKYPVLLDKLKEMGNHDHEKYLFVLILNTASEHHSLLLEKLPQQVSTKY